MRGMAYTQVDMRLCKVVSTCHTSNTIYHKKQHAGKILRKTFHAEKSNTLSNRIPIGSIPSHAFYIISTK